MVHDEGKDILVTIAFLDEAHAPVTPATAHYRLTSGAGAALIDWTAIGALGPTVTVTIPAVQHTVPPGAVEARHVAVRFTYGIPEKIGTAGVEYQIRDLAAYAPLSRGRSVA